jgi:hypothetical protein
LGHLERRSSLIQTAASQVRIPVVMQSPDTCN